MTTKPESRVRTKILKYLRSLGGKWMVIHGGMYQEGGVADILGCYQGNFYAFEVKTPKRYAEKGHSLSALQVKFILDIQKNDGRAFCVCSVEAVMSLFRKAGEPSEAYKKDFRKGMAILGQQLGKM